MVVQNLQIPVEILGANLGEYSDAYMMDNAEHLPRFVTKYYTSPTCIPAIGSKSPHLCD